MSVCLVCGKEFTKADVCDADVCPDCLSKSLPCFDNLPIQRGRFYAGSTGSKRCVIYKGKHWMLKRQESLKDKDFKNVEISYANDPISEYIGAAFYRELGVPVHDVVLGTLGGEMAVLCSDRAYPNKLIEFKEFRNTLFDRDITQSSDGMSTALKDIFEVIEKCTDIPTEDAYQRFFTMLVIDSILGNTDRNNGNWGFIYLDDEDKYVLYDVYDLGGSLNNKRSDKQMEEDLANDGAINRMALDYTVNFTVKGKRINPFHFIESNIQNRYIRKALGLINFATFNKVDKVLESIPIELSKVRIEWYRRIMRTRITYLLHVKEKYHSS